jgi:hypothetical protein
VKVDLGEVLTRAWQIAWRNKQLWLFGGLMSLVSFLFIPLMLLPMLGTMEPDLLKEMGVRLDPSMAVLIFFGVFILFMVFMYPVSTMLNGALALGVLRGERGGERSDFADLLRDSLPYFWRLLGTMLVFVGGMLLVTFVFFAFQAVVSILTMGLGSLCFVPLSFLQYPFMLVWYVCMEQALAGVVVDNLGVMESVQRSWQLFRSNIWVYILFGLVFYFGVGMLSGIVMIPMFLPLAFLPLALESRQIGQVLLWVGGAGVLVMVPVFAVFQGWVMTLMKSSWILAYLRLTQPGIEPQLVPPTETAA